MDTPSHPDPFHDAWSHGLQRAVQVASSAVTGAQAYAYLKRARARTIAVRDQQARRAEGAQINADRDAARAGWTPALDRGWIQRADVLQTARVWGAAMPYADPSSPWHEPTAETAMRNCEERLRELHPNAMARYDRLRGEEVGPAEAMYDAAFLFAGPPRSYDPSYMPRPVLEAGNGESATWNPAGPSPDAPGFDLETADVQERRGRQIVEALQDRARAQGQSLLGGAEQRIVLETITNLPADVIDRVVQTETAPRASRVDQPWKQDFPLPISDVLAAAGSPVEAAIEVSTSAPVKAASQARPAGLRP